MHIAMLYIAMLVTAIVAVIVLGAFALAEDYNNKVRRQVITISLVGALLPLTAYMVAAFTMRPLLALFILFTIVPVVLVVSCWSIKAVSTIADLRDVLEHERRYNALLMQELNKQ